MQRKGILAAGNFIIDIVKMIEDWPVQEALVSITGQEKSNGGGPFNVLKDLSLLKVNFPLEAMGCIGDDDYGNMVIADLEAHGISTKAIQKHGTEPTSFTDVMTVQHTGKRTFFHNLGANRFFDVDEELLAASNAKIFYLAYLMLLDNMDSFDGSRTKASIAFEKAKNLGFITATDIVSRKGEKFKNVVSSALPFVDYLFINELEAELLTGIKLTEHELMPAPDACVEACRQIFQKGVNQWVILHFPYGVVAVSKGGEIVKQGSVNIPPEMIVGAVGAGDAFAAGALAGIHEGKPMEDCLKLGVSCSATCLQAAASSAGIKPMADTLTFGKQLGFRVL